MRSAEIHCFASALDFLDECAAQKFTVEVQTAAHEFSVLRKTIHIFNSQAQTLSDHTLFPDSSLNKCATVRTSDVVLRGRFICSSKRKLQKKKEICRSWRRKRAVSPRTITSDRERDVASCCKSQNILQNFPNFER